MNLRFCLTVLASAGLFAHSGAAQATASVASAAGVWRGVSLCQVRPSACHDETVVYRIVGTTVSDSISVDALKIVNGQEEDMGVLGCRLAGSGMSFRCTMRNGVWHFTIRGDSLLGELRLLDSTKFRDMRAVRSPTER